jgi:DNA-binding beta-propeller fold protein YncE
LIPPDGGGYSLYCIDVNRAGTLLYGLGIGHTGPECFIFDLEGDSLISSYRLYGHLGVVKLHPDEHEVYISDPGLHVPAFTPGTIYVLDAFTGQYLQGISLWGYYDDLPYLALDPWNMEFSPDGSQLFVQTGNINRELGTVLRIDTKTKTVESLLFPEIDRLPEGLAVGPKP